MGLGKSSLQPNVEPPVGRYQHFALFMGSFMLVVGGRTNNLGENVPLEVYDCESSDRMRFLPVQRFRHSCWMIDTYLYVHGGFEQNSPNIPADNLIKIDTSKFFQNQTGRLTKMNDNPMAISFQLNVDNQNSNEPNKYPYFSYMSPQDEHIRKVVRETHQEQLPMLSLRSELPLSKSSTWERPNREFKLRYSKPSESRERTLRKARIKATLESRFLTENQAQGLSEKRLRMSLWSTRLERPVSLSRSRSSASASKTRSLSSEARLSMLLTTCHIRRQEIHMLTLKKEDIWRVL